MKTCPYCTKTLPFINIVWQRVTASEEDALKCSRCKSVISNNGGAAMWPDVVIASFIGGLAHVFLGDLSPKITGISLGVALVAFIISSYFTAPIRNA